MRQYLIDNAIIKGLSEIYDNTQIYENAEVDGNIHHNARIYGNAKIIMAQIYDLVKYDIFDVEDNKREAL